MEHQPASRLVSDERMLAAIRRIAARAAAGGWAADISALVADELLELLDADATAVLRYDGAQVAAVAGAALPGRQIFTPGARFPLEPEMIAAQVRRAGTPLRQARYDEDSSDAGRRIRALGYDVVVGAPIVVEGETWGVIYAGALGPHRLPPGVEHELGIFADLCTIAVASAEQRLRRESQQAEQEALLGVARSALAREDADDVLAAIAREAAGMLGATAAALLRHAGDGFEVASVWSSDHERLDPGNPSDQLLAEQVRRSGRVEAVADVDRTSLPDERDVLGLPAGWAAPIHAGGRFWGALLVGIRPGTPVSPDAAERVARFAQLSELAVDSVETRRELLDQLIETERFVAVVELADDFIAIADLQGGTAYLNAAGRRLVGLESIEEARAAHTLDYLTEEGRRHFLEVSGPTTRRSGTFRGETTLRHFRTGEEIPVAVSAHTIRHPVTGRPVGTAIVQYDLRERRRTEAQLREHAERVEQLASARRALLVEALESEDRMRRQIGDALHDDVLQELYAAKLDLGNAAEDPEAVHRARVAIDAATRQLRAAVSDLHPAVAWTRDLESRVRAILERAGDRAGVGHRLTFAAHTSRRVDDLVLGLLRELVQNVVKHAEATFIEVTVRDEADGVLIEVGDDGRGMAPDRPAEALQGGHVGLASARERVEALGGTLTIDSAPGRGTRVTAVLPGLP